LNTDLPAALIAQRAPGGREPAHLAVSGEDAEFDIGKRPASVELFGELVHAALVARVHPRDEVRAAQFLGRVANEPLHAGVHIDQLTVHGVGEDQFGGVVGNQPAVAFSAPGRLQRVAEPAHDQNDSDVGHHEDGCVEHGLRVERLLPVPIEHQRPADIGRKQHDGQAARKQESAQRRAQARDGSDAREQVEMRGKEGSAKKHEREKVSGNGGGPAVRFQGRFLGYSA